MAINTVSNPWTLGDVWRAIQTFMNGIVLSPLDTLPPVTPGQIFLYNDRVYITCTNRRIISRGDGVMTSPVTVSNTTTETTLWSETIAANGLKAGKVFTYQAYGKYSTQNASETLTIRFKLNDVTIASIVSPLMAVSDKGWYAKAVVTIRTVGTTGAASCFSSLQINEKASISDDSSETINTTIAGSAKITAQWGSALVDNVAIANQGFLTVVG